MTTKKLKLSSMLDVALVASLAGFVAVLINANSTTAPLTFFLLMGLTLAITVIGIWRESNSEKLLDEVQLAGASFGARWGISAVIFVTLLATFFAPLQGLIETAAASFGGGEKDLFSVPVRLFILGLVSAMIIELSAKFVAATFWHRTKR